MAGQIKWKCSKNEIMSIHRIAKRAVQMAADNGIEIPLINMDMDITACHLNGNELDLAKLEYADDGNFGHDVFGIREHIDRKTGKLTGFFSPRCTLHMPSTEQQTVIKEGRY